MAQPKNLDQPLEALLAECDDLGLRFALAPSGDRLRVTHHTGEPATALHDSLLADIVAHRESILSLVRQFPRELPSLTPMIALSLDRFEIATHSSPVAALLRDNRVYYRLTPRVLYWVWDKVDSAYIDALEAAKGKRLEVHDQIELQLPWLLSLGEWITQHYRPDEIARGSRRRASLPSIASVVEEKRQAAMREQELARVRSAQRSSQPQPDEHDKPSPSPGDSARGQRRKSKKGKPQASSALSAAADLFGSAGLPPESPVATH
jgi:hypothetical protein